MTPGRKILYTIAVGFTIGAVAGILYAPNEGSETRRKIKKLKRMFGGRVDDKVKDRDALMELRSDLRKELHKLNARLEALGT